MVTYMVTDNHLIIPFPLNSLFRNFFCGQSLKVLFSEAVRIVHISYDLLPTEIIIIQYYHLS